MPSLNILMAQMNTLVGDFDGNTEGVIEILNAAARRHPAALALARAWY